MWNVSRTHARHELCFVNVQGGAARMFAKCVDRVLKMLLKNAVLATSRV